MHIKKPEKYDCNLGEIRQNQEGDKITEGSAFQHKNVRLFQEALALKNSSGKEPYSRRNSTVQRPKMKEVCLKVAISVFLLQKKRLFLFA